MFYPSSFWPHKNHRMLITAYNMFLSKHPEAALDLVFSGGLHEPMMQLKQEAEWMGFGEKVHFLGHLSTDRLISVYRGCNFLIFPARYENDSRDINHALTFNKPILCSNIIKYRRAARKSASYFDPRKPDDIAQAISKQFNKPKKDILPNKLYDRKTIPFLGSTCTRNGHKNSIFGRFKDGWTSEELIVTYTQHTAERFLELRFELPLFFPYDSSLIELWESDILIKTYKMFRENELTIYHSLSMDGGVVNILFYPAFQPLEITLEPDKRILGVSCRKAWITSKGKEKLPLFR